jgi:hypothetical protein
VVGTDIALARANKEKRHEANLYNSSQPPELSGGWMQLSAAKAQRVSRTMHADRGAIFSKHQPPLFSERGATRFCRRSISLRNDDRCGRSAIAQHGICPQRVLSSNRSGLISL